jgi:hypothetical protein
MASSEVGRSLQQAASRASQSRGEKLIERRRACNRAYMRRWRADPRHTSREQLHRRRSYHNRKLRMAKKAEGRYRNLQGELFCGFCRRRPSIMHVKRLKTSAANGSRYVEIRIPYCGEC